MKNKTTYILIAFFSIILSSCEKIIEFNGKETAPVLVMNGLINADSTIHVQISKSRFFLDNENEVTNIDNATVKLWINDIEKTPLSLGMDGNYYSGDTVKADDIIKITVSENSLGTISSTTIIPHKPLVESLDTFHTYKTSGDYKYRILNFDLNVKDYSQAEDYYLVYGIKRTYYDKEKTGYYDNNLSLASNDVIFQDGKSESLTDIGSSDYKAFCLFTDNIFNGKNYSLRFQANADDYIYYENGQPITYYFYLQKISKEWYLYLKTIQLVNSDLSFFAEPVQVYTNITNGLGILGAANTYVKEYIIE